ncbi:MAG: hypothetical protein B9S32_04180 [Verrucomicrobia bacterium Tous-C9LFEB]|nr:MAG: hypothetical protein B9S32_04180 [Verrucomicrobia bacterium Tous-C9LFEB]
MNAKSTEWLIRAGCGAAGVLFGVGVKVVYDNVTQAQDQEQFIKAERETQEVIERVVNRIHSIGQEIDRLKKAATQDRARIAELERELAESEKQREDLTKEREMALFDRTSNSEPGDVFVRVT